MRKTSQFYAHIEPYTSILPTNPKIAMTTHRQGKIQNYIDSELTNDMKKHILESLTVMHCVAGNTCNLYENRSSDMPILPT